jgi:hypothetical protein
MFLGILIIIIGFLLWCLKVLDFYKSAIIWNIGLWIYFLAIIDGLDPYGRRTP